MHPFIRRQHQLHRFELTHLAASQTTSYRVAIGDMAYDVHNRIAFLHCDYMLGQANPLYPTLRRDVMTVAETNISRQAFSAGYLQGLADAKREACDG